jgi:hypothetical protein
LAEGTIEGIWLGILEGIRLGLELVVGIMEGFWLGGSEGI